MKINKVILVSAVLAGSVTFAAPPRRSDTHQPPPPPPRGELHERLCEGGNCCNFDVDGRTLNYTLRCDHKIKEAELTVGGRRSEVFRLYDHGRLHRDIDPREKMSIHLIYPPKPNVHTRLCDGGNCCELNVNNTSLTYGLRCDRAIQNAELIVGNHRTEVFNISENGGRIAREIDPRERMSIRLSYPPPPTHKSARAKAIEHHERRR